MKGLVAVNDRPLREPGSIAEGVKPLVENFSYNYTTLHEAFVAYMEALEAFDDLCALSLDDSVSTSELARAREELNQHAIRLVLRYPDLARVSGKEDYGPDHIEELELTPQSLKLYSSRGTLFKFVGNTDSHTYMVAVKRDGEVTVEVDPF